MNQFVSNFLKGMGIGTANVIPGVSGGTIALLTGIFERLINCLKSFNITALQLFFKGKFKELVKHTDLWFLLSVGLGVIAAIFTTARIFDYLFKHYPVYLWSFFFGMILTSIYFVGKTIDKWNWQVILSFLLGTGIAVFIAFVKPATENSSFIYLIICGAIATCSMILPGLSGSFILIIMGNYQLVMIDSVDEENKLTLSVTAVRREATAETPEYDIPERTYNIVNYNADPDDVRAPLMIIPPADLVTSASGLELWIALQGKTRDWGGCDVYASTKDGAYEMFGRHNRSSNYGKILTAMTASSTTVDVEFSNVDTVEILEGSAADAENCLTDIWVNGECMAYTGSTLIDVNEYRLTGLQRGRYGTQAAAHAVNDGFAMLDGDLFCVQLPKALLGKTLYLKFPSFNTFGNNLQQLNDVDYYNHIVRIYDIPNVVGLSAVSTRYTHTETTGYDPDTGDPITRTWYTWDVTVRWQAPDWPDYGVGRISYRRVVSGTPQAWSYVGQASNELTVRDIDTAGTYTFAVATKDINGNYETEDDSSQVTVTLSEPSAI